MFLDKPLSFRATKEIKAMLKELLDTDKNNDFEESEGMVIRAAIIHFYNSRKIGGLKNESNNL